MTDYRVRAVALDQEGCAELHEATLEVLEQTGVEVQHEPALALLRKAGAKVDGTRVRMPAALVTDALAVAPRSIPLASRSDEPGIVMEAGPVYYGTGLELPRSMAANCATGAKEASSSCGCAMDMTKSTAGSFSCSAAISSTSSSVTGRRSRAPGPSRKRQSEPVP